MNTEIVAIQEKDLTLVVTEQSLGTLVTNAKQIRAFVENALSKYSEENYSEDNIDQAKKDKAMLNKFSKSMNDKRIEIQKEFLKPFDEFKAEVDGTIKIIKEASSKIDNIVKGVEDRAKNEKRENIKEFYKSLEFTLVDFERIFKQTWLNKSTSMKSIREEIQAQIEKIKSELRSIEAIGEDVDVLKADYLEYLSLEHTLNYSAQLKSARERIAQEEQKKQNTPEEKVPQRNETPDPKGEGQPEMYERAFKVLCTREQLIALGNFMNERGIKFQKIEQQ